MAVFDYPGVPPLQGGFSTGAPPDLLTNDDPSVSQSAQQAQWGLYKDGEPVVAANSVLALGLKRTATLPTYPQEDGAFQNYNKVQLPYEGTVRFTTGGSVSDRTDFVDSVDDAQQSLDLYDLVMPEKTWQNVNVPSYDFNRTALSGLGLLIVDVEVEQIRLAGSPAFSNTATPSGADPVNDGVVPTSAPSTAQQSAIQQVVVTPEAGH